MKRAESKTMKSDESSSDEGRRCKPSKEQFSASLEPEWEELCDGATD